jgi:anti-sigma factor RsiW
MSCEQALKTQAWFDGELDEASAAEVERHVGICAECTALLAGLTATRETIRESATRHPASPELRARLNAALDREEAGSAAGGTVVEFRRRGRSYWGGALAGALSTAAAAAVAAFLLMPPDSDELVSEVTNAHVRSLIGTHLLDVSANDAGTADTWLTAHTGLARPFPNVSAKGYRLVGARADYVYEASAAVAVYKHGNHVVNVFAWAQHEDEALPETASSHGYNIVFWKRGNVVYCAVSNVAMNELADFSKTLRSAA